MIKDDVTLEKLAIFDLDGTLVSRNTLYDFLLFYFKRNSLYKYLIVYFSCGLVGKLFWLLVSKVSGQDDFRFLSLRLLEGELRDNLICESVIWSNSFYYCYKNVNIEEMLNFYRNNKYEIFIISGSLDFIVAAIASHLSVTETWGVKLDSSDGIFRREILQDPKAQKSKIVRKFLTPNIDLAVITDNLDDIKLINLSNDITICSKRKNVKVWQKKLTQDYQLLIMDPS